MDFEQALKTLSDYHDVVIGYDGSAIDLAMRIAMSSLEKQISKKPSQLIKRYKDCVDYECANCGMTYGLANPQIVKYCYHCGQALDQGK